MISVKVLGSGCANCQRLEATVRQVIAGQGIEADVQKVTDYAEIMRYGVLATPALVVAEKLVAAGRIPPEGEITRWLREAAAQS